MRVASTWVKATWCNVGVSVMDPQVTMVVSILNHGLGLMTWMLWGTHFLPETFNVQVIFFSTCDHKRMEIRRSSVWLFDKRGFRDHLFVFFVLPLLHWSMAWTAISNISNYIDKIRQVSERNRFCLPHDPPPRIMGIQPTPKVTP